MHSFKIFICFISELWYNVLVLVDLLDLTGELISTIQRSLICITYFYMSKITLMII